MTRLGYQIPNFTYPGTGPADLFEVVAAQAAAADASGFDTVLLMDHFFQLPMLGPPENYMLECYTTLAGLARETSNVRLGALVTGNTYRNPTLLAKSITTLDIVSGGRAQLGIGAGWFELEHDSLGYEFGTFTDRFEKLEESLQIILPMLRGERPTFAGKHYSVKDAINEPPPVGRIPVMIGGSGEKKTLRIVAQYGDESNLTSPVAELGRKLDAIAEKYDDAYEDMRTFLGERGLDLDSLDEDTRAQILSLVVWGDPDGVGERLRDALEHGADGLTLSLPANGHVPGRVELLGEVARTALGT